MKNRLYILIGLIALLGILWLFFSKQGQLSTILSKRENKTLPDTIARASISPQPIPSATNSPPVASASPTAVNPKETAIKALWASQNAKSQDFYGKVVDQNGEPVTEADVIGNLAWIQGFDVPEKNKEIKTKTDSNGEFEFTGIQGWELGVVPSKPGYELARNTTAMKLPADKNTSLSSRAVFIMWKLKGAEPMISAKLHAYIPCDGSATSYNLLTGKPVTDGGDMTVKLTRNPVNIVRGKPFGWTVTLEVASGGLVEQSDVYPNEAPAEGYQPSVTYNMPADMPNWSYDLSRSFYFKSRGGQDFGRMTIHINANFQPPPTLLDAVIYANPAGSRNLEYDPAQQVNPR